MTTPTPNATAGLAKLTEAIKPILVEVSAEELKYIKEYIDEQTKKILFEEKKINDNILFTLDSLGKRLDIIDENISELTMTLRGDKVKERKQYVNMESIINSIETIEKHILGTNTKTTPKNKLANIIYRDNGPNKNMFEQESDLDIEFD